MSKLNQYPTEDDLLDADVLNFWKTSSGAVKKTSWANFKAKITAGLTAATGVAAGITKLYANVTGNNVDGAPDQNSVKLALADKADLVDGKVPVAQIPEVHYRGTYLNIGALETAVPEGNAGDEAIVDPGGGTDAQKYIWDEQEGWVAVSGGGGVTSFNSRTGPVTSQAGDYTADQITETAKLFVDAAEKTRIANALVANSTGALLPTPDAYIEVIISGTTYRIAAQNMTP